MTSGAEVDLDRLADYVGGVLDGTPEAAEVRHLIETDARWAEAHEALLIADGLVLTDLRALGATAPGVPDDVADRLEAALRAAASTPSAAPRAGGRDADPPAGAASAPQFAPPAVRQVPTAHDELAARRRRRQRWKVGLAAAAAVVVCGAGGVGVLSAVRHTGTSESTAGSRAGAGADAPHVDDKSGGSMAGAGSAPQFSTGTDYTAQTIGKAGALVQGTRGPSTSGRSEEGAPGAQPGASSTPGFAGPSKPAAGGASHPASGGLDQVPGSLQRLTDPDALVGCLAAVRAQHGGLVIAVDYAAFEGAPALIVLLDGATDGGGRRLVVVVGPACGADPAVADQRYQATI